MKIFGEVSLGLMVALAFTPSLTSAGDTPSSDVSKKYSSCYTEAGKYTHGALMFFNQQLCLLNVQFPGIAEEFLYRLVVDMKLNPDVTKLSSSGTATDLDSKTYGSKTVSGSIKKVVSPDTFSGTYDYRAEMKVDGTTFAALYWSGSGSSSKGFMTMGGTGLGSSKSYLYVKWDRTTADQAVSVLGMRLGSASYLSSVQSGDDAMYGKVAYNSGTKVTSLQMTHIGKRRGASSSDTTPGCFKMFATGTKGGTITVGKTVDANSSTGDLVTDTYTNSSGGTSMDSATVTDSTSTANLTGNSSSAPAFTLNYPCNTLYTASGSGKPFEGNTVNFSMTKTQMDAMFP